MSSTRKVKWIGTTLLGLMIGFTGVQAPALCAAEDAKQQPGSQTSKAEGKEQRQAHSGAVKEGDLVTVNYTASLEDGTLVYSTSADVAHEPGRKKMTGYVEPKTFGPEETIAGKPVKVPGIGESVVGMKKGEKKQVTISAESAFGPSDPKKMQAFPCVRNHPKTISMMPSQFVDAFQQFPIVGENVSLASFLKARINEVTKSLAVLELLAKDGEEFKETYGTVVTRVKGDEVTISVTPLIGAPFKAGDAEGRISGTDGKTFTVDFNPPVAGKRVVLDVELVDVKDASALESVKIGWIEDLDQGFSTAKKEGKPSVLLLYADWCSWCKKLLTEVIPDPRIKAFGDRLVWIKANSDKQKDLQKKYEQNGFPLILLFDKEGQLVRRIDGFADVVAFKEALGGLLALGSAKGI